MNAEPGPFEAFYGSAIQHPILLWLAAALAVAACLARGGLSPSVRRYCAALGLLSVVDAWLTTNEVFGLGPLSGWAASLIPLFFVLAGDLRYLLVVTAARPDGSIRLTRASWSAALGLMLIVPVFTQIVGLLLPGPLAIPRVTFLTYEVAFFALTASILRWHPGARSLAWVRTVSRFVLLYYGLWAGADLILLASGSDWGHLLRVLPNLLYYGGLIAVIGLSSRHDRREAREQARALGA